MNRDFNQRLRLWCNVVQRAFMRLAVLLVVCMAAVSGRADETTTETDKTVTFSNSLTSNKEEGISETSLTYNNVTLSVKGSDCTFTKPKSGSSDGFILTSTASTDITYKLTLAESVSGSIKSVTFTYTSSGYVFKGTYKQDGAEKTTSTTTEKSATWNGLSGSSFEIELDATDKYRIESIAVTYTTTTSSNSTFDNVMVDNQSLTVGGTLDLSNLITPKSGGTAVTGASVDYSISSGNDYATLSDDHNMLTGVAAGTVVIKASITAEGYDTKEIYFNVNVTASSGTVTFVRDSYNQNDGTERGADGSLTKDLVTLNITGADGLLRWGKNGLITINEKQATSFTISLTGTGADITGVKINYGNNTLNGNNPSATVTCAPSDGTFSKGTTTSTWTATSSTSSVTFTISNGESNLNKIWITSIEVNYSTKTLITPAIILSSESIACKVGDVPATPNITLGTFESSDNYNLDSRTITYATSDATVIPLDEEGNIDAAQKAGTVTITITVAGDETYYPATATYVVTVTEADPELSAEYSETVITCDLSVASPPTAPTLTVELGTTKIESGNYSVIYSSDDETVMTVSDDGTLSFPTDKKVGETTITAAVTYTSGGTTYTATASYMVKVVNSSDESTVSLTESSYTAGDEVATSETINGESTTTLTMTFGGVPTSSRGKGTEYSDDVTPGYFNTDEDALNESIADGLSGGYFDHSKASNTSASLYDRLLNLPVYGDYFMFEPVYDGTLTIDVDQQGAIYDKGGVQDASKVRVRPLYCIDELGLSIAATSATTSSPLNDEWNNIKPSTDDNNATIKGDKMFTADEADAIYNYINNCITALGRTNTDGTVNTNYTVPILILHSSTPQYIDGNTTCVIEETDGITTDGLTTTLAAVRKAYNYGNEDNNNDDTGYFLLNDAKVTYTFELKAGKTYFIFGNRTKLGLSGFTFKADVITPESTTVTLVNDTENGNSSAISNKANDGKRYNVTVKRSFTNGKWASLVLPFSVSPTALKTSFGDDVKVVHFDDVDGTTLNLIKHYHQMIVAGTPVFIRSAKDIDETTGVTFNNTLIQAEAVEAVEYGDYLMTGSYDDSAMPTYSLYLTNSGSGTTDRPYKGQIMQYIPAEGSASTTKSIKALRSWIQPQQDSESKANIKSFTIIGDDSDSETTGIIEAFIDETQTEAVQPTDAIYNLSGQLVGYGMEKGSLPKGIYVSGGKKFVIR